MKKITTLIATILTLALLSGCAALEAFGESFNREWAGVSATMTTYNEEGVLIDSVHGRSFQVDRDTRFDTSDSDGISKRDSQVLLISIGDNHISHVGSSMIMAQDGLSDIVTDTNSRVDIINNESGMPWLNNMVEMHRNLWQGKSKTIMIRSQNGSPIAVYAGNEVEIFSTSVPKSTWFRVDGKYLFVYRSDYTVYDTELLGA